MARSLGVVIPAYRPDVDPLTRLVRDLEAHLSTATIRIELDAPTAATRRALDGLPATVNAVPVRRGKGAAITHGFEALSTDVLAFVDADGSVPAASLADVVEPVDSDRADLAVGSRRHPAADVRAHQTWARRWLGHGFARLARFVLDVPLYDFQCGAKAVNRATWRAVRHHLYEPGFAWDVEFIAMADAVDARIVEVPVVWIDRPGSTVDTVSTTLALARALLASRHRAGLLQERPVSQALDAYHDRGPAIVDRPIANDD